MSMATKSTKYTLSENGTVLYRWRNPDGTIKIHDSGRTPAEEDSYNDFNEYCATSDAKAGAGNVTSHRR